MTSFPPLRLGVLSTAKIAREKVIPAFKKTPLIALTAIASRDAERVRTVAAALSIPKAYTSYEALLADPTIEAVYIPTPNDSHVDLALASGRAGKHVLSEKPAGLTESDAARLAAFPEHLVYLEGFMVRHHPQWLKARDLVREGRIGTPLGLQAWFSYFNADPNNIRNKPETGGGALLDIGCYPLVVARFVLEAEPRKVVALIDRDPAFGTDRLTSALIDFGEGRQVSFTVSTQAVPYQRVNIFGSRGRIELMIPFNAPPDAETVIRLDNGRLLGDASAEEIRFPPCDHYTLQAEAFAKAVRGIAPLPYGARDARQMMRLLDAVTASAEQGTWIALD